MTVPQHKGKSCSWCGKLVAPNAARMRLHQSEGIRVSGIWMAHFHPECGDELLDYCEERIFAMQRPTLEALLAAVLTPDATPPMMASRPGLHGVCP